MLRTSWEIKSKALHRRLRVVVPSGEKSFLTTNGREVHSFGPNVGSLELAMPYAHLYMRESPREDALRFTMNCGRSPEVEVR